jgi:ATP-dependent Clp protease ATP-binding subunit ClpA
MEAQRAIDQARNEALRRGSKVVTVADLLAGLSWEEGTRADRLASLKSNAMYLRWLVGLPPLPANRMEMADTTTEFDHGAKIAMAYARSEADRDDEPQVNTDHLLRGLLRFPNVANFALLKIEVRLQSCRVASKLDREELLAEDAPALELYQYRMRKYLAQSALSVLGAICYLYILIQNIAISMTPATK